jgi:4-hydroxy-tetrahydrodipicolinate reductase
MTGEHVTFRVIQWAVGAVGADAVAGIVQHPDLELVGAWVRSPDKAGRDVGELCGREPMGVTATQDVDALLALDADCVCFMPGRTWVHDPSDTLALVQRILRSGTNVANLWWPMTVYPSAMTADVYRGLQQACAAGGSSFCTVGMDPGYGTAGLALSALTLAREVTRVHMYQFMNNAFWEGEGITSFFGFGQPDAGQSPILLPGVTTNYHATTLHLVADAIGATLDGIVEDHTVIHADEAFDVASGHIPEGTVCGVRYRVTGMVRGEERVVVEHVEKLRAGDFPELDFAGDGYRAEVSGVPDIRLDMRVSKPAGYDGDPIAVACAMSVVNAVPQICEAPPGVLSMRDLRPFPSRGGA